MPENTNIPVEWYDYCDKKVVGAPLPLEPVLFDNIHWNFIGEYLGRAVLARRDSIPHNEGLYTKAVPLRDIMPLDHQQQTSWHPIKTHPKDEPVMIRLPANKAVTSYPWYVVMSMFSSEKGFWLDLTPVATLDNLMTRGKLCNADEPLAWRDLD